MRRRQFFLGASLAASRPPLTAAQLPAAPVALLERRHRGRSWTVCRLDPAAHRMDLFLAGGAGALRNFTELDRHVATLGRRVVVAMNGGMFEADGSPVGWCVAEGRTIRQANLKEDAGNFFLKPNGVFP